MPDSGGVGAAADVDEDLRRLEQLAVHRDLLRSDEAGVADRR